MHAAPRSPTGLRRAAGTTLIVVLLAAVAVTAILVRGGHLPLAPNGDPPIGEAARKPADPLVIADFAGLRQIYKPFGDFAGLLTPAEIAAYAAGGPGRIRIAVGDFGASYASVAVVAMRSPAAARRTERALTRLQLGFGFTLAPDRPAGVDATVVGTVPGRPDILPGGRAHYTHGKLLVRIEYRGPGVAAAQRAFATLVAEQVKALPADG